MLGDGAYGSGDTLAALAGFGHKAAIKPFPLTASQGRFDRDDFAVDEAAGTATCPAGHTVTLTPNRNAIFGSRCHTCPLRARCTTNPNGRTLRLHRHDTLLVESQRDWREGDFAEDYRRFRPMVERTIAWMVARGNRKLR